MALTQGAWTPVGNTNDLMVWTCNVAFTTDETDAYTLKTPTELDPTKPWTLAIKCAATPDGQALPLDIWIGWNDSFALSGQGANVTAGANGGKFKQIFDDVVLAVTTLVYTFLMDPDLPVADVVTVGAIATGPKVRIPPAPYYAFNLNGGSSLNATNIDLYIIQKP